MRYPVRKTEPGTTQEWSPPCWKHKHHCHRHLLFVTDHTPHSIWAALITMAPSGILTKRAIIPVTGYFLHAILFTRLLHELPDWLNGGHILEPSQPRNLRNLVVISCHCGCFRWQYFLLLTVKDQQNMKRILRRLGQPRIKDQRYPCIFLHAYLVCGLQSKGTMLQDFRILGVLWLLLYFLMQIPFLICWPCEHDIVYHHTKVIARKMLKYVHLFEIISATCYFER